MMSKDAIKVGDTVCQPGERAFGKLLVGYHQDSAELNLWTTIVNGAHDGPTIYLGGLIHGTEIIGVEVIHQITRQLVDPKELRGAIIAIPIQNPLAYRTHSYHSLEDGLNANRIFPGDIDETLTNRIVAHIYKEALSQSNYALDFHSNVLNSIHFNFIRWREEEAWQKSVQMSQAFGTTTVLSVLKTYGYGFEERLTGLLCDVALEDGIPTITIELTAWYHWNEPSIRAGVRGTLNVMKYLDMIDGEIEEQDEVPVIPHILGPQLRVTAEKGGIVRPVLTVGDFVTKDQVVAVVKNPWGDVIEEIRLPTDCYLLSFPHRGNHAVSSGDTVVFGAPVSDLVEQESNN
jgi:predicted deacylase